ncbi:MAG: SMP-30/gluconolactonase/LRE family protein [Bacteroidales bacterium]
MRYKLLIYSLLIFVFYSACKTNRIGAKSTQFKSGSEKIMLTASLFAELPEYCPTPDALEIAPDGSLTLSCPNYADKSLPPVLMRIDANGLVKKLTTIPGLTDSTFARPVGLAYAPDGSLFVCDNQGKQQGRILRLTFNANILQTTEVVAYGLNSPNGIRYYKGSIYVTQPQLPKFKTKKLTSAVYRFNEADRNIMINNDSTDINLIFTTQTQNPERQFGLDGLVFDKKGNLLVGDFGDATIFKLKLDENAKVIQKQVFAQLPNNAGIDGMCFDSDDNLYVVGFSQNEVFKISPQNKISLIAHYPDNDGSNGIDQPADIIVFGKKLIISNFDLMVQKGMLNSEHGKPYTLSFIKLKD